jgi:hypothetical protein
MRTVAAAARRIAVIVLAIPRNGARHAAVTGAARARPGREALGRIAAGRLRPFG